MRTRRLSREDNDNDVVQQNVAVVDDVSCARVGVDQSDAENVTSVLADESDDLLLPSDQHHHQVVVVSVAGAEVDEGHDAVAAAADNNDDGDNDNEEEDDDLTGRSCFSSSDDRQTVVQRFESNVENSISSFSNNVENRNEIEIGNEVETSSRSWASLIDEEEEEEELQSRERAHEDDRDQEKEEGVKETEEKEEKGKSECEPRLPDSKAAKLLFKSFASGPPSWRAMGDAAGRNCGLSGAGLNDNPKWRRAAVRAVQIQEIQKQPPTSGYSVTGNHVASKSRTGNGGIGFDILPPPPILPGGIPQPPPPPAILPPGPWGDPACVFTLESTSNRHGYDTDSTEHSSSHSSVLVDMGKVVGVLRSSHPGSRPHQRQENNIDNSKDINNDDEDEDVPDLDTVNENSAESMVLATRSGGGCASCAAASAGKSPKPGSGELDDSLCGDPLMYATFVAPVHQYSTETEPSRQTSFNYPSRQPSFKQNSSEAEPQPECGYQQQQPSSYLGGQLSVPRCSSSGSADYERSDEVRDIYEEVPTIDRWPLPPLPQEDNGECSVEVSQEELEQQLHMERMSFMSGSSANEEDEDEMFDDKDNSLAATLPPPPPPPLKSSLHLSQPYRCRSNRDIRDLSASPNVVFESYRPAGVNTPSHRQWLSAEDSDGVDVTSGGTVRRKAKRERNKTTTGVITATAKDAIELNNSASVSPACSAPNVNKSNSFKRSKPVRSKCPVDLNPPTPPPPVPPHQHYYKSHTVLEGPVRPSGLSSHHVGRLASPDQFSESSASFHENEFVSHDQPQTKRNQAAGNVTAEVHHHPQLQHHHHHHNMQQQQQQQQQQHQRRAHHQQRRTPPPPQFSNRDSVRESWMSSGSECQGHVDDHHHHHHHQQQQHHYVQHHHKHQQHQNWSHIVAPPPAIARTTKISRDFQQTKPAKTFPTSTTLPRPSRSVGNLTSVVAPASTTSVPLRATGHYSASSRSLSRESGSSSSRAGSKTDQSKSSGGRHFSTRQDAQEGKNNHFQVDVNKLGNHFTRTSSSNELQLPT